MSDNNRFQQLRELFERCLEQSEEERAATLSRDQIDPELRARVQRLLELHSNSTELIDAHSDSSTGEPEQIGPYRILQRLGEGGVGIVYAAEQRDPVRRRVAVKVLRGGFNSREVLARFDVERQALSLMTHTNIAHIIDAGTTADHRPFIVMEYVPGETITRYCELLDLPLNQRLELFCKVCDAVQHAHQRGVIHRDLKPSNILVMEEDGRAVPKVIDFGIAKATTQPLTDHTLETQVGSLLGTPDYMSPEQAELSPLDIDTRTDVYSLGAVLYQLLTGVTPLGLAKSGRNFIDIQRAVHEQVPAPPSRRVTAKMKRQLRGELDWITMKALEKQRAERYASPADLARDLRNHLANRTVIAGPPSRWRAAKKFTRRHWLATVSTIFVAITLAVSQVMLMEKNRELQIERDRANTEAARSEGITAFVLDIFKASGPDHVDAGEISARELLDRSQKQIAQDTSMPEDVRLHMVLTLKQAYKNLGMNETALQLFRQARSLYESGDRRDPKMEYEILSGLGRELVYTGRAAEAREPLIAGIRIADAYSEIPFKDTVLARTALSDAETVLGNYRSAHRISEEAWQQAQAKLGMDSEYTWIVGMSFAASLLFRGDIAAAEDLVDEVLSEAKRAGADTNHTLLNLRDLQATIYVMQGRIENAERLFRPIYEIYMDRYGLDAGTTQALISRYAPTLADPEAGLQMLLKLLEHQQQQHKGSSPFQVLTLESIGKIHLRIPGNEGDAEHYLNQAIVMAERIIGPEHFYTRSAYMAMARLYARTGREENAMVFLRKIGNVAPLQYEVARHPDFRTLHGNPEFAALLGKFSSIETTG